MLANGLLARLDHAWLPNLAQLESRFQQPDWDPELKWSAPYMVTAAGIAYNRKLNPPPRAWAVMWDRRLGGKLTMLDDPFDTIRAALTKLGLSVNTSDRVELLRPAAEAIQQKLLLHAALKPEVPDPL